MEVFNAEGFDAIIVNAAGCGAMLKDYASLARPRPRRGRQFVSKVKDISEFLVALGPITPKHSIAKRVAYHDACHLCHGQQIRSQPRQLLSMIPGLDLVPLEESELCCGRRNPTRPSPRCRNGSAAARWTTSPRPGAEVVVTGNVGCILQTRR